MAQFAADLLGFRQPLHFFDTDPTMEMINQFNGMNSHVLENPNLNLQNLMMMPFSCDGGGFLGFPETQIPRSLDENVSGLQNHVSMPIFPLEDEIHESKKRKAMDMPETSSANSTPAVSESGGSKMKTVMFFNSFE